MVVEIGTCRVVANIDVERAVPINVRHGNGRAGQFRSPTGKGQVLGKMTTAVIDEKAVRTAARSDDKVKATIAIDVRQRRGDRVLSVTRDSRANCDVLKTPVAQVA